MNTLRHIERRETLAYWPARDEQSGESVGLVTDISTNGINIHSHEPFEHGHKLNIRMSVDPNLSGSRVIHLHVVNVWSQLSGISGHYHAGFKIVDLSADAREAILKLLSGFSYPAPGTGLKP